MVVKIEEAMIESWMPVEPVHSDEGTQADRSDVPADEGTQADRSDVPAGSGMPEPAEVSGGDAQPDIEVPPGLNLPGSNEPSAPSPGVQESSVLVRETSAAGIMQLGKLQKQELQSLGLPLDPIAYGMEFSEVLQRRGLSNVGN
jgi:hypothetical protein